MSKVLNRLTKQLIAGVDTADYDQADWIHDPDVADLLSRKVPARYWKIVGDIVSEADEAEKLSIDVDEDIARRAEEREREKAELDLKHMKVFAEMLIDEINILREVAGMTPRSFTQFRAAFRTRMDQ